MQNYLINNELLKELQIAKRLAFKAGKIALKLQNNIIIKKKPNDEGIVTSADLLIDKFICHHIGKEFPNDNIISEESYIENSEIPQKGRVWYIDPIDGTSQYAEKKKITP